MRLLIGNPPKLSLVLILCALNVCFGCPIIRPGYTFLFNCEQLKDTGVSLLSNHFQSNHDLEPQPLASKALPDTSAVLPKRHAPISNQILRASPSRTEPRGFSDLAAQGYKLVWEKFEVIINSIEAYDYYHHFYYDVLQKIEASNSEPSGSEVLGFVGKLVLTYGVLELEFDNLPPNQRAAYQFLEQFVQGMFVLIGTGTLFGTFQVAAIATNSIVLVTLLWVGNRLNNPGLIG